MTKGGTMQVTGTLITADVDFDALTDRRDA